MSVKITLTFSNEIGRAIKDAAKAIGKEPGTLAREWVESKMTELSLLNFREHYQSHR